MGGLGGPLQVGGTKKRKRGANKEKEKKVEFRRYEIMTTLS